MTTWRGFVVAVVAVLLVAGCRTEVGGGHVANPALPGQAIPNVMLWVDPAPEERFDFVSAELLGPLEGATVEFFLSRPVPNADGGITVGERIEPLGGAAYVGTMPTGQDAFGIVGQFRADEPGTYEVPEIRVHYRNGLGIGQTIDSAGSRWIVCVGDPAPMDCDFPTDED